MKGLTYFNLKIKKTKDVKNAKFVTKEKVYFVTFMKL